MRRWRAKGGWLYHRELHRYGAYVVAGVSIHTSPIEWVEDRWNPSYHGAPNDGSAWTSGDCSLRVVRGDSFGDKAIAVRFGAFSLR